MYLYQGAIFLKAIGGASMPFGLSASLIKLFVRLDWFYWYNESRRGAVILRRGNLWHYIRRGAKKQLFVFGAVRNEFNFTSVVKTGKLSFRTSFIIFHTKVAETKVPVNQILWNWILICPLVALMYMQVYTNSFTNA